MTTPAEGAALLALLEAVQMRTPEALAACMGALLAGRDMITRVQAVAALAVHWLEGALPPQQPAPLLRAVLAEHDRTTRDLFEQHLAHRFGLRRPEYSKRLEGLLEAVGPYVERASRGSAEGPADQKAKGGGLLGRLTGRR